MENSGSFKEEAHAFKEDSFDFESPSPSVSPNLARRVVAAGGSRVESHSRCRLEGRAAGSGSHVFVVCRVSGFGAGTLRRDCAPSIVRQLAQTSRHARTMAGGGSVRTSAQVALLSIPENCDRPSSDSVPRRAERAGQRIVSQSAQVGDDEISRLCHSVRGGSGLSLHAGRDLRSRERADGCRAETAAGADRGEQDWIRMLLLDRGFFASHVMEFLQKQKSPFVIPIVLRGRKSKKRASKKKGQTKKQRRAAGLRAFRNKPVGRYAFTWDVKNVSVTFHVVVAYKSYKHHKTGRRHSKRLLYAVWNVGGAPLEIREPYRKRFGIEASYRQLGQARIRTCTDDPVLRLFFVLVALVLRNVWVWLHFTYFAERGGPERTLRLERLRLRRMLNWIAYAVTNKLHDGSDYVSEIE